jgi:hypothetical protein
MPSPSFERRPRVAARVGAVLSVAVTGVALAGCAHIDLGSAEADAPATTAASCPATIAAALRDVASNVAGQAASGRTVSGAAARVARSTALGDAVASNDPAAVTAALRPLLRSQIKRIVVTRGGRVLASVGHAAALGPVGGAIRDSTGATVGNFTLSTSKDAGVASLLHGLTGAQVVILANQRQVASTLPLRDVAPPVSGSATVGGATYSVASLAGTAFPSGPLRISLLSPAADGAWCAQTSAATTANALGAVAERLFHQERGSTRTGQVLRLIARDPQFATAVAADDPVALRAQIVRFFGDPALHVVRIRARTERGPLVNDVGGPYVLAPASATVRLHGRAVGQVTASIQDDAGFIKLVHRFTGADVILRAAGGQVPGSTLSPGPARLPARGAVHYGGRSYQVFSFTAKRFPSGPLRVSLLVR